MSIPDENEPQTPDEGLNKMVAGLMASIDQVLTGAQDQIASEAINSAFRSSFQTISGIAAIFVHARTVLHDGGFSDQWIEDLMNRLLTRIWSHPTDFTTDQFMFLRDVAVQQQQQQQQQGGPQGDDNE